MHAVELPYCNFKTQIPSAWNELSKKNLLSFCRLMLWHDYKISFLLKKYEHDKVLTPEEIKTLIGLQLRRTLFESFAGKSLPPNVTRAEVLDFIPLQDFLFKEDSMIEKWLMPFFFLPAYRLNPFPFFGPGDLMKYITISEISYADMYLNQYIKTKEEHYLDKMIAVVCRQVTPLSFFKWLFCAGDIRPPFNDNLVERHAKKIKRLPLYYKTAILFLYKSARNIDRKCNAVLYETHGDEASKLGWAAVIINLSGEKAGTINQVQKMLYSDAIVMFLKAEEDRQKFESKLPSNNNN